MASEPIDSLLVELGLDVDREQFEEADSLFTSLQRSALAFGAVIGAGAGLAGFANSFAQANDELGKFAELMGVSPQLVDSLGFALQREGGEAEDAFGTIRRIRELMQEMELGQFPTEAMQLGFDTRSIEQANSVAEALENLARQAEGFGPEKRRRIFDALGFQDAEIRLFGRGADTMQHYFNQAERLAPVTKEAVERSADFNDAVVNMEQAIEGFTDAVGERLLPEMTEAINEFTGFVAGVDTDKFVDAAGDLFDILSTTPFEAITDPVTALRKLNDAARSLADLLADTFSAEIKAISGAMDRLASFIRGLLPDLGGSEGMNRPSILQPPPSILPELPVIESGELPGEAGGVESGDAQVIRDFFTSEGAPGAGGAGGGSASIVNNGGSRVENNFNFSVDARGSNDPQQVEKAVEDGVRRGLDQARETIQRDFTTGAL